MVAEKEQVTTVRFPILSNALLTMNLNRFRFLYLHIPVPCSLSSGMAFYNSMDEFGARFLECLPVQAERFRKVMHHR